MLNGSSQTNPIGYDKLLKRSISLMAEASHHQHGMQTRPPLPYKY